MKLKKLLAVVLSAVMAVSVLSACGGGSGILGNNDGGAVSSKAVNAALDDVGSIDIKVVSNTSLNSVLKAAGEALASGESESDVKWQISTAQKWTPWDNISNLINSLTSGAAEVRFGQVEIVKANELEKAGLDSKQFLNWIVHENNDEVKALGQMKSTAKVAAAMTLYLDGYVKGIEYVVGDITTTYTVSATAVEAGSEEYYIIAVDVVVKK